MPLIQVRTSVAAPEKPKVEAMLKELSASLAQHLSKSESYVMTAFEADVPMTFGGSTDPTCYIAVKSIGTMTPETTKAMSQDFCQKIERDLGISASRVYVEFGDVQRHMWGWNGSTFG